MPEKWNMDRKPTRWERIYGSVLSLIIFLLTGAFTYGSAIGLLSGGPVTTASLVTFIVATLFLVGSGVLLLRVTFGAARKPSRTAILASGYFIAGASIAMFVLAVSGLENQFFLVSTGLTGLAGSISIISKARAWGD